MNIEYTVIFVINFVLNDFIKIILVQEHIQTTIVKVNDFKQSCMIKDVLPLGNWQ